MFPPIIDPRDKQHLIEQMKEMVPYYTPEWRFIPEDPDPGTALFLIFADMFEENIKRLNRVPLKNFISFLNMLGVSLSNAKPAKGYVTFTLTKGAAEPVFIPKGTPVFAELPDEEPVLFETEGHLLVTPAVLAEMYNVSVKQDTIIRLSESATANEPAPDRSSLTLFDFKQGLNLQEHWLYLGHPYLFNIQETVIIELECGNSQQRFKESAMCELLADTTQVEWLYYAQGEWHLFDEVECRENKLILKKTKVNKIEEQEIEQETNRWIACRLRALKTDDPSAKYADIELDSIRAKTDYYDVYQQGGFAPDRLFYNDLELDAQGFYPFGQFFSLYDSFYIGSQEAFSKKNSRLSLTFSVQIIPNKLQDDVEPVTDWKLIMRASKFEKPDTQPVSIIKVIWEYWNGSGWVRLVIDKEYEQIFYNPQQPKQKKVKQNVVFHCPEDIVPTFVNSQENYWIRARVESIENLYSTNPLYHSPWIDDLRVSYTYTAENFPIQSCLTYNNVEFKNRSADVQHAGTFFKPFYALDAAFPALYLGFEAPPVKGPISLYFSLEPQKYSQEQKPLIEWEFLSKEGNREIWSMLKVNDGTDSLTKSGLVQFAGPPTFTKKMIFGRELYWIRAFNRDEKLENRERQPLPQAKGIYLNTISVLQQESIHNELPEKASLTAESFALARTPVLEEEIWVDEAGYLTEEETELLQQQGLPIKIIRDSEGNIQQLWVRWQAVDTFLASTALDRHYVINRTAGLFHFGNGQQGKVPPKQAVDSIRVHYKVGGGTQGNVEQGTLTNLRQSIPFIQTLTNHEPASGGSNVERVSEALQRGPQVLKHRHRAVTVEDFEWLAREAAPEIAKVTCLANYNVNMEKEIGCITIVILPKGGQEGLLFFSELKHKVEKYLMARAASTVAFAEQIQVIQPAFLEISISVTLVVQSMEAVIPTETEALHRLAEFLNPYTGNYDKKGWDIGQQIHYTVFYTLLNSINTVTYVSNLLMTVYKIEDGQRTEIDPQQLAEIKHGVVVGGAHKVIVQVEG